MLKGWLTRLSTPPRLSASVNRSLLMMHARRNLFSSPSPPPKSKRRQGHLLARQLIAGAGQPGNQYRSLPAAVPTFGGELQRAFALALYPQRQVRIARSVRKLLSGSNAPPDCAFCR